MALCDSGVLQDGNRALHEMLGYAPDELEGRALVSLLSQTREGNSRWVAIYFAYLANQKSPQDHGPPSIIAQFSDVTHARAMSSRLMHQASHDDLTGLINRREFEIRLEAALENTRTTGAQHAVCYFDLDQFKVVNDISGHATGDRLLCHIANTIGHVVRKTDTLARQGWG